MARDSNSRQGNPSFFKILLDPSAPYLPLPPSFVRRHLKDKIPKNPRLRLGTGEISWQLKIKEISGDHCFASGWVKFVKDTHLGQGDFLIFWLIDHSTFEAKIYGPSGCEKDFCSNSNNICDSRRTGGDGSTLHMRNGIKIEDEIEEKHVVKKGCSVNSPDDYPSFQKIISSKTHKFSMGVPKEFLEEAGIEGRRSMIVKDLQGREWSMNMRVIPAAKCGPSYYLSKGWPLFREHNQLSDGDICLFKFIKQEGKLALTQVIKKILLGDHAPPLEEKRHTRTPERENAANGKRKGSEMDTKSENVSTPAKREVKRRKGRPPLKKSPK